MLIIVAGKLSRAKLEMNLVSSVRIASSYRIKASCSLPRELCNICAHPSHFLRRPQDSFASGLGVLDIPRPQKVLWLRPLWPYCDRLPCTSLQAGYLWAPCPSHVDKNLLRPGAAQAGQGRAGQAGRKALKAGTGAQGGQPPAILAILAQSWGRRGPTTSEPSRREGRGPPRWPRPADSGQKRLTWLPCIAASDLFMRLNRAGLCCQRGALLQTCRLHCPGNTCPQDTTRHTRGKEKGR